MSIYSGRVTFPGERTISPAHAGRIYGGRGIIEGMRVRIIFRGILREGDGGSNHQLLGDMVRSRSQNPRPNEIDFQAVVEKSGVVAIKIYGNPATLKSLQGNPDRTRRIGKNILDAFSDLEGHSYEVRVGNQRVWWPEMPKKHSPLAT